MFKALKKLWNDDRGNILVIGAVTLPLVVGSAGLATDTIQWALWKRQLQRAADSAAMAAVYERVRAAGETTNVSGVVTRDLELNQHTGIDLITGYPKITFPADTTDKKRQVYVQLAVKRELTFSSMFMRSPPNIIAGATAAAIPSAEVCVLGLDRRNVTALEIGGSTSVNLDKCSGMSNSTHPNQAATNVGNGSTFTANKLMAAGGVQGSKSDKWQVGSYEPATPAIDDPLAALPTPSTCDKTITISDKQQDYPIDRSGSGWDDAGKVTCITGGLDIKGKLTLGSGTYVVNGGDLTMHDSGTKLICTSCTIILSNMSNPAATGNFRMNGGEVSVSAPSSGTYKGVAFYQDRRATDDNQYSTAQNFVNGNSDASITGAIYTPGRSLKYNGGGGTTGSCMQVIGKRVSFSGNSKFKLSTECGANGPPPIQGGQRIRLVG
ncbi:pilus assembly protein TadG-related protein [Sphingomonas sp. LY29]|uniref:pilus assembly protein TadG-related protein n=1 Tax=Sphingomonas sp. LY29 TaxID=3095341 RepID=UPI002D76EF4C|nr:pilus assembly protein TadG-related protein [Sphingomonas sp. LY29]WRP25767.1 pilus assembly protein TadG-related protein [Sphingomonas sp. LY29]